MREDDLVSKRLHVCDDGCVCPVHGTPLIYWPHGDDHACQDVTCRYGHGMSAELLAEMPRLMREWRARG